MANEEVDLPKGAESQRAGAGSENLLSQFVRSMRDFSGGISAIKAVANDLKSLVKTTSSSSTSNVVNNSTNKQNVMNSTTYMSEKATQLANPQKPIEMSEAKEQNRNALQKSGVSVQTPEKDFPKGAGSTTTRSNGPMAWAADMSKKFSGTKPPDSNPASVRHASPVEAPQQRRNPVTTVDADFAKGKAPTALAELTTSRTDRAANLERLFSKAGEFDPALTRTAKSVPYAERDFPNTEPISEKSIPAAASALDGRSAVNERNTVREKFLPTAASGRDGRSLMSPQVAPRTVPPPNRSVTKQAIMPDNPHMEWADKAQGTSHQGARATAAMSGIPSDWKKPEGKASPEVMMERVATEANDANIRGFKGVSLPNKLESSARTNAPEAADIGGNKGSGKPKELKITGDLNLVSMNSEVIGRARASASGSM